MKITVVNKRNKVLLPGRIIYVGREAEEMHFGNPFTHKPLATTHALVKVSSRDEAIRFYGHWLDGTLYPLLEPKRREWIKHQIIVLAKQGNDLILQCWCAPSPCHGDVLRTRILDTHFILLPKTASRL